MTGECHLPTVTQEHRQKANGNEQGSSQGAREEERVI